MEEKDNERQVKESGPGFKVIDKRHSVKKVAEGEKGDDIQSKKYPSYVEELRSELDKKDKILKEYIESYKNMKKENREKEICPLPIFSGLSFLPEDRPSIPSESP